MVSTPAFKTRPQDCAVALTATSGHSAVLKPKLETMLFEINLSFVHSRNSLSKSMLNSSVPSQRVDKLKGD